MYRADFFALFYVRNYKLSQPNLDESVAGNLQRMIRNNTSIPSAIRSHMGDNLLMLALRVNLEGYSVLVRNNTVSGAKMSFL